jgi:hypothetical protein
MRWLTRMLPNRAETLILLVVMMFGISVLPQAAAHTWTTYYGRGKWPVGNAWSRDYQFTVGFPTGNWRSRVNDAFDGWDALPPPLHFSSLSPDRANFNPFTYGCPGNDGKNAIHYLDIDQGSSDRGLAAAVTCTDGSRVWWGQLVVDSIGTAWWLDTAAVPAGKYDLWSAAAQEAGHIGGFLTGGPILNPGHWPEGDANLCADLGQANYPVRETMCEGLQAATRIMRTPSTHDAHTFDGAY